DRPAPRAPCRASAPSAPFVRWFSDPALDLEARRFLRLFARDGLHRLPKGPEVAFKIARAIGAVAVELRLRLLQDRRARRARSRAMAIDILNQMHVHALRILAA